jgi:4a-hydroxytetrahydrobiopterin dehydratase
MDTDSGKLKNIAFSSNVSNPSELTDRIRNLTTRTQNPWHLAPSTTTPAEADSQDATSYIGLERSFKLKTFRKAMELLNAIADEAKKANHHPEWAGVYNVLRVRWTTHRPAGLSEKDVILAERCDDAAAAIGEEVSKLDIEAGRDLLLTVVEENPDCCSGVKCDVPKSKPS